MEEVVAIKVVEENGEAHFFITWGRVFTPVSPEAIIKQVELHLPKYGIHEVASIGVCRTLREASDQPYFYEALLRIGQERIPYGRKTYPAWSKKMRKKVRNGKEIHYLGRDE